MQNLRELINMVDGAFIQVPFTGIEVYRADTHDTTTVTIKRNKNALSVCLSLPDIDITLTKHNIGLIEKFTHDLMTGHGVDIYAIDNIIKDNFDTIKKLIKLYTGYDQAKYVNKIKLLNQTMVTLNNKGRLNDNQIIKVNHIPEANAYVITKKRYDVDRQPFISFEMTYGELALPFTLVSSHLPAFISYDTFKMIKNDNAYFAATYSLMEMLDYMTEKDGNGYIRFFEYVEIKNHPTAKNVAKLIHKIKRVFTKTIPTMLMRNIS
jgi:hypothetical protein